MAVDYGAYVQLLAAARADNDPAHRQLAWDAITPIAPMAGATRADGHCPADGPAAGILARLYPAAAAPAQTEPAGQLAADITGAPPGEQIPQTRAGALPRASDLAPK